MFTNSVFSFTSTVAAVAVLLSPFTFLLMDQAVVLTFLIGTTMAFILGNYVGKISHENPYRTGLKYALLAILGAVISHFIADFILIVT